jgi:ferric-dicitrate binding protein FerR (iron transport regulator)
MTKRPRKTRKRGARRNLPGLLLLASLLAIGATLVAVLLTNVGNDSVPASTQPAAGAGEQDVETFHGGPRLAIDPRSIDHGDVAYGQLVDGVYHLRNVGDAPLEVSRPFVVTREGC